MSKHVVNMSKFLSVPGRVPKPIMYINSFNFTYYPYFTDEETEAEVNLPNATKKEEEAGLISRHRVPQRGLSGA